MQMQWGVRACKTTEEENFVCCTTTRGQQFTTTVSWELELSNAGFIHGIREKQFKLAKQANANHTSIKFSYSHSMTCCATLTLFCYQPLHAALNALCPATAQINHIKVLIGHFKWGLKGHTLCVDYMYDWHMGKYKQSYDSGSATMDM